MPTGVSDLSSLINSAANTATTSATSGASNDFSTGSSKTVTNASSEDPQMFIKLLASSIANQDPMNPSDSNQFLNQMTQYSTIESMNKITSSLTDLKSLMQSMNMYDVLNNATNVVGKNVEVQNSTGTGTSKGVVDSVQFDSDGIYVVVNGAKYKYTQLTSINNN